MHHTTKEITAWREENKHSRESPVLGESLFKSRVTPTRRKGDRIFLFWFDFSVNYAQQNTSNITYRLKSIFLRIFRDGKSEISKIIPKRLWRHGSSAVRPTDWLTVCLNIIWALNRPYKTGETKGEKEKREILSRARPPSPLPRRENLPLDVMGQPTQLRGKNTWISQEGEEIDGISSLSSALYIHKKRCPMRQDRKEFHIWGSYGRPN